MPVLTPTDQLRRILVARTDGLGDVIVTLPIAVALKQRLPGAQIAFLVTPYTAPIVRRIAEVDEVLTITEVRSGLHVLKAYKPDAIIFAKPDFRLALEAVIARVDVRVGTGYRWYSGLFTRWVYEHRRTGAKHEAQYGVNLLSPILNGELTVTMPKLPISSPGMSEYQGRLADAGHVGEFMVLHPGSRGSAALYPPDQYARVANALLTEHSGLSIVITAGPGEEELARNVASGIAARERVVVLDKLSLDGLSELLRAANGFLGSSSGPAHLAALVGTPVVGLYPGLPPVWPARWKPLGDHVTTLVPHPDESFCPECGKKHQPENCVKRIAPERVIEACRGMLIGKDAGTTDYIS
ncbi:MAG: glycosyltransferase family 9 protein [Bacteroidetes bacterium]|nr:glycosyltransferase family 9 protein [Bacteroidota bacterium]